jgi:hypothetical protein
MEFKFNDGVVPVYYSGIFTIVIDKRGEVERYIAYRANSRISKTNFLKTAQDICELINNDYIEYCKKFKYEIKDINGGVYIKYAIKHYLSQVKIAEDDIQKAQEHQNKIEQVENEKNINKERRKKELTESNQKKKEQRKNRIDRGRNVNLLVQKIMSLSNKIDKDSSDENLTKERINEIKLTKLELDKLDYNWK